MIKIVTGNILEATEKYICQQVNCQGVMGAGVAKALYQKWPNIKQEYHSFCDSHFEPIELLGKVQIVPVEINQYVVNIFGQLDYGRNSQCVYTDYDALEKAFSVISQFNGSFAFPYGIGSGLANGDWSTICSLIYKYFGDKNATLYKLPHCQF